LAPRNKDPGERSNGLRNVLLALVITTPVVSAAAAAPSVSRAPPQRSQPARFSDIAELTPANVQRLLPLVARGGDAKLDDQAAPMQRRSIAPALQADSLSGADLSLQHLVDERARLQLAIGESGHLPPLATAPGCEISYVIGTPAAVPAGSATAERELRAWDPLERRVLWSVTEALPLSARALVTAGGLVFYGTRDGWLKALDARSGRTLWQHHADGRALDAPFSYRGTDGHQYIAVHSLPRAPGGPSETLLIFALAH
jgi:hypothetical protein